MADAPLSIDLGEDERAAFAHFRREARALGTISHAFDELAAQTAAAYFEALRTPAEADVWTTLVVRTAALVAETRAFQGIVALDRRECEALQFFETIVDENADLLGAPFSKSDERYARTPTCA